MRCSGRATHIGFDSLKPLEDGDDIADFDTHMDIKFADRFFSTRTTSLMGSSLENLEQISRHPIFREAVKILVIQDDSHKLDPIYCDRLMHSNEIWPYDKDSYVISSHLNIQALHHMLAERRLRPKVIRIRNYRMDTGCVTYCSSAIWQLHYPGYEYSDESAAIRAQAVSRLAKDIVQNANLTILSIRLQSIDFLGCAHVTQRLRELRDSDTPINIGSPTCHDITLTLSPSANAQGADFSLLRSAEVEFEQYWWENVIQAPLLEDLKLEMVNFPPHVLGPSAAPFATLTRLELSYSDLTPAQLIHMLAHSKQSLTDLTFQGLTLKQPGQSWRSILLDLGRNCTALARFFLRNLRIDQGGATRPNVDFWGFNADMVPVEGRAGLDFKVIDWIEDRPPQIRVVQYEGPRADLVLERLAECAH